MTDPGYVLKAEQTVFADGWTWKVRETEASRMTPKLLAWAGCS